MQLYNYYTYYDNIINSRLKTITTTEIYYEINNPNDVQSNTILLNYIIFESTFKYYITMSIIINNKRIRKVSQTILNFRIETINT